MYFPEGKGNYQDEQGLGQGQCKNHEAEISNGLRPPVFLSFTGKGNYYPLPLPAVNVGYLLHFRGQGQWLLYLKYLHFVQGWLRSKAAGVQISPGHVIFFFFYQRSKGQGKGNAKSTRRKLSLIHI